MSIVRHDPAASAQPVSAKLELLGLELAATSLELDMLTRELLGDARELVAAMEGIRAPAPVPSQTARSQARCSRPVGSALRRALVVVPVACVGLLAGVMAFDTVHGTSSVPAPAAAELAGRQLGTALSSPMEREPASVRAPLRSTGTPPAGAPGRKADVRTFSWPAVPVAVAYEFILLRGQERIFSRRLLAPRLTLPASWRFRGKRQILRPGVYRWIVLPVKNSATGPVSKAVVAARLVVD